MVNSLCADASILDLRDPCIRAAWSALVPTAFVFVLCIFSIPVPQPLQKYSRFVTWPFQSFLTLEEADALDPTALSGFETSQTPSSPPQPEAAPLWRTLLLSGLALVEALAWLAVAAVRLAAPHKDPWTIALPALVAISWLYAVVRPSARTAPGDLFALYVIHFVGGILLLGGILYDSYVSASPSSPARVYALLVDNLIIVSVLLAVVLRMPMGIPSATMEKTTIGQTVSTEDYSSLWGWFSFRWILPLINKGASSTLSEDDVWRLSPTMQSRPLFIKFSTVKSLTLFRRLLAANSFDLIVEFVLTLLGIVFNYAGPFFLNRILSSIDSYDPSSREERAHAYIYAFLAFFCAMIKSQFDLNRLWFNRRVATRMRTELMVAIYDKALKRKDLSGSIVHAKEEGKPEDKIKDKTKDTSKDKDTKSAAEPKKDEKEAGADIGKIVNLMSGDAKSFTDTVQAFSMLYSAPFEIAIAVVFLYKLLGLAAFAGFSFLIIIWPINHVVAKRMVRIFKSLSTVRDRRMTLVSELIGGVRLVKFFAWEERWIARVSEARKSEISWLIQACVSNVLMVFIWTFVPLVICLIAFLVYVMQGNQLTVPTAFTAIALFDMLNRPLNILPSGIVNTLQSFVALQRIATFLQEDEVDSQVSTIKQGTSLAPTLEKGLGMEAATFKWNENENKDTKDSGKGKGKSNGKHTPEESTLSLATTTTLADSSTEDAPIARRFELSNVTVRFPERQLSVVTGPTASGKSALLMSLLGELTLTSGRLIMHKDATSVDEYGHTHTLAYAAQAPWLRHQTIRENILFGMPYNKERYDEVVECCALLPDLAMLEDGDETEIGARGVSLSGGQKARVALARAVYSRARYVLLDDPLSAVDSHTARFIFERLLQGPILAHRTVILVTHHVQLVLPATYYLIRMLDGRIDVQGTVAELRQSGVLDEVAKKDAVKEVLKEVPDAVEVQKAATEEEGATKKPTKKLVEDEHREVGGVKWSIYKTYLKASSYWTWVLVCLFIVTMEVTKVAMKFWMKAWGQSYKDTASLFYVYTTGQDILDARLMSVQRLTGTLGLHHLSITYFSVAKTLPNAAEHPLFYVAIYFSISIVSFLASLLVIVAILVGSMRACKVLFNRLLVGVTRATMRWHDRTPQGRILNRFGNDIKTIDLSLAHSLEAINCSLASFLAAIVTVAVIFPTFLVPGLIITLCYRQLAIKYLRTGRDLRRMESNTRSPIFSGFSELLEGIVTVRAHGAEKQFLDDMYTKTDLTTKMWYTFWMTNRWLLLNFDALGAVSVLGTTLWVLSGYVDAGLAAICITSALSWTMDIYWTCRFWTGLELDLNSVERIVEYLNLPQEPPAIVESHRPPAYWPSSSNTNADGMLVVEDLVIKYAPDLPAVLHNVSFNLKARERVGLIGRTGSGKSTLAMSILRFVEPTSGKILIDGIDISTIGLYDLRSRLTFIPQDAILFSGTLKENLDPFGDYEDSECLDVLRRVHLISQSTHGSQRTSRQTSRAPSIREGEPDGDRSPSISDTVVDGEGESETRLKVTLDTQVSAGGSNFSQGQRQLIAMARALLRRSSIIILDEATSSIDFATDARIQATIREEFNDSLLLTVAHRLRTVADYDKLIVLDEGKVVEFDTPYNLIQKKGGIFRSMCVQSGTFEELESATKVKAQAST